MKHFNSKKLLTFCFLIFSILSFSSCEKRTGELVDEKEEVAPGVYLDEPLPFAGPPQEWIADHSQLDSCVAPKRDFMMPHLGINASLEVSFFANETNKYSFHFDLAEVLKNHKPCSDNQYMIIFNTDSLDFYGLHYINSLLSPTTRNRYYIEVIAIDSTHFAVIVVDKFPASSSRPQTIPLIINFEAEQGNGQTPSSDYSNLINSVQVNCVPGGALMVVIEDPGSLQDQLLGVGNGTQKALFSFDLGGRAPIGPGIFGVGTVDSDFDFSNWMVLNLVEAEIIPDTSRL